MSGVSLDHAVHVVHSRAGLPSYCLHAISVNINPSTERFEPFMTFDNKDLLVVAACYSQILGIDNSSGIFKAVNAVTCVAIVLPRRQQANQRSTLRFRDPGIRWPGSTGP